MKKLCYFLILTLACISCQTQRVKNIETGINFINTWKFKTGDSVAWSSNAFDDASWDTLSAGKPWEEQGYQNYDGVAWYRKSITIPASVKNGFINDYKGLLLCLGKIDDADEVCFNGKLIGHTGSMRDRNNGAYSVDRNYVVPEKLIRWDSANLIAVRVMDFGGNGGMYSGKYTLHYTTWIDYVTCESALDKPEGIYSSSEKVVPTFTFANNTGKQLNLHITFIVNTDQKLEVSKNEQQVTITDQSKSVVKFECGPLQAGFYTVKYILTSDLGSDTLSDFIGFGVDPTAVKPALTRPADFDEYWNDARKELAAVKPGFKMIPQKEYSTKTTNVYLVEMYSLGNALIRGWYSVPVKKGKYPAMLRVQGYSSSQMPDVKTEGFVVFVLNIRGHGNSKDSVNPGFPGYLLSHIDDKEKYIYRGAYMDCLRAVDFICSRPEADTSKIVVLGGSQGGALSFATAALDKRIKLCSPHIPFLSDFRSYFKIAPWPANEFTKYVNTHPETNWDKVYGVLDYIDIKNLAPWIKVPILMGVGLKDMTCPPYINFAAFNNVSSTDKEFFVYPNNGHSCPDKHFVYEMQWIKKHFNIK